MLYVTSDLHGCSVDDFQALLGRAGFCEDDFLFILGDVIDRGEHGAELLLWLTEQTNMELILGNHEALMLSCEFLFGDVTDENLDALTTEKMLIWENWLQNGGGPTIRGLRKILKRDPELLQGMLDYLKDAPLYECVEAGNRRYILVHAGLGNFHPKKRLDDYSPEELLMTRPEPDEQYFPNATVILGHTPTVLYGEEYAGRLYDAGSWICIDTGAAMGGSPMLLRLEDGKAFY